MRNEKIVNRLSFSKETVKSRLKNLYQELDVSGRRQAAVRAEGLRPYLTHASRQVSPLASPRSSPLCFFAARRKMWVLANVSQPVFLTVNRSEVREMTVATRRAKSRARRRS